MEMEPPRKKHSPHLTQINQNDSSSCSSSSKQKMSSSSPRTLNDLPKHITKRILDYLDIRHLLICRHVNWRMNKIANSILQDRPETEMTFYFVKENKTFLHSSSGGGDERKKTLRDFIKCFSSSKNFPYARFIFRNIQSLSSSSSSGDLTHFLSHCGQSIKSVKLGFSKAVDTEKKNVDGVLKERFGKLRGLLTNLGPTVQEFGLLFDPYEKSTQMKLFPSYRKRNKNKKSSKNEKSKNNEDDGEDGESPRKQDKEEQNSDSDNKSKEVEKEKDKKVQLDNIKILHLSEPFNQHAIVIRDLLLACTNLQRIQSFSHQDVILEKEDLELLHSTKKLQLINKAEIHISTELANLFKGNKNRKLRVSPPPEFKFQLKEVTLVIGRGIQPVRGNWSGAGAFISHLYESSKDTLEKLNFYPIGFLDSHVKYPVEFSKLKHVEFSGAFFLAEAFFPSNFSLKSKDIFSHVHTIDFGLTANCLDLYFPEKECCAPYIPTVENLYIEGEKVNGSSIETLALMFPNLKRFFHGSGLGDQSSGLGDFPSFGRAVWKSMNKLEELHIKISMETEKNSIFPNMDSTFTGISRENCRRLFTSLPGKMSKSEAEAIVKDYKEGKSIVDLKHLKHLCIQFKFPRVEKFDKEFRKMTTITKLSDYFAFQLMAHKDFNYQVVNVCDFSCRKNFKA